MYIVEITNGSLNTTIHGQKTKLSSGTITKGINCIDSFTFSMFPDNPGFSLINEFQTHVTVYNTNKERYDFIGRALYAETTMDESGMIKKTVTCESLLGYLCDSVQTYVDTKNWTVYGLLYQLISCHNSQVEEYKKFRIGEVTATDKNDNLYVGIQRDNTWDSIGQKLIEQIGGELCLRVEDGVNYIDYLEQMGEEKETEIALSYNMKSITREKDPTSYVTRLIPFGCKLRKQVTNEDGTTETVESEERLSISNVNNGLNYIDDEAAIALYGIHVGCVTWDDVTAPGTLLTKGKAWLVENNKVQIKYSITALDLSLIGLAVDDFDVGNYHPIKNALLGIDDVARIIKKTIDICEETQSSIEVGDNFKTLSDIQREQAEQLKNAANKLDQAKTETNNLIAKINKVISSLSERVTKIEGIEGLYFYVAYSQYEDGHDMTAEPNALTEYMGVCSTSEATAPTDYTQYTWSRIRGSDGEDGKNGAPGEDGKDGKTQYLHIKYSDDGETFTANSGETLGAWIGTLVDFNEADSTTFSDYTWKKFTEDVDQELEDMREEYTTQIQQLSDSIKLELSGSLGSEASIILSVGANKHTGNLSLSQVRKAFADDPTAISISAGIITFNSNTIVINSTNFSVTSEGVVTAKSGTIGAITLWESGLYSYDSTSDQALTSTKYTYAGLYKPATVTKDEICFFAGAKDQVGTDGYFSVTYGGAITATRGTIGAITLSIWGMYSRVPDVSGTYAGISRPPTVTDETVCFYAGATNALGTSAKFSVTYGGAITATSGTIGAITLWASGLYSCVDPGGSYATNMGTYAGLYRPETITADTISFFAGADDNVGTSSKFSVSYGGTMTAKNAVVSGEIETNSGNYKTELKGGRTSYYYSDVERARIYADKSSDGSTAGLRLRVEENGSHIAFCHVVAPTTVIDYVLNYGWTENYPEGHIFYTTATFVEDVYMNFLYPQVVQMDADSPIRGMDASENTFEMLKGTTIVSSTYGTKLGHNSYPTMIAGSTVYLKNTSSTVTSDRRLKNSIEDLPDAYEAFFDALAPVRFKYNEGTSGRYHVGYIAQDVESALASAGLETSDFAGYVDIEGSGELGLAYNEFIALLHQKIKRLESRISELESVNT